MTIALPPAPTCTSSCYNSHRNPQRCFHSLLSPSKGNFPLQSTVETFCHFSSSSRHFVIITSSIQPLVPARYELLVSNQTQRSNAHVKPSRVSRSTESNPMKTQKKSMRRCSPNREYPRRQILGLQTFTSSLLDSFTNYKSTIDLPKIVNFVHRPFSYWTDYSITGTLFSEQ